jgi:hypothetical protein
VLFRQPVNKAIFIILIIHSVAMDRIIENAPSGPVLKMIFKIANETDAIPSKIQIQTIHCQL